MKSTVTRRGQTVIPAPLRQRYCIEEGTTLEWIDGGGTIKVIPLPRDALGALRGIAKGEQLLERLLTSRREDKEREG
jgi:AbrB family looped-hinge helix DNA binding protein